MGKPVSRAAFLIISVLFVAMVGIAVFYYSKYHEAVAQDSESQARALTARLGQVIDLPSENPTIAQVADKNKLGNELLAKKAENGDQILIFSKAKRAILYRPSTKKVIDMYPLSTD